MADETTETGTAQLDTGTALSAQPQPPENATAPAQAAPADKLAELEKELQKLRSQQGREAAEQKRQAAAAQKQAREAEDRAHQAAMANMDELQQARYMADLNGRRVQELQAQLETQMLAQLRFERISALSEKTGVPFAVLNQAETPDDMAVLVATWKHEQQEKTVQKQVERAVEKRTANAVDLGGGGGKRGTSGLEEKIKTAREKGAVELAKLLFHQEE